MLTFIVFSCVYMEVIPIEAPMEEKVRKNEQVADICKKGLTKRLATMKRSSARHKLSNCYLAALGYTYPGKRLLECSECLKTFNPVDTDYVVIHKYESPSCSIGLRHLDKVYGEQSSHLYQHCIDAYLQSKRYISSAADTREMEKELNRMKTFGECPDGRETVFARNGLFSESGHLACFACDFTSLASPKWSEVIEEHQRQSIDCPHLSGSSSNQPSATTAEETENSFEGFDDNFVQRLCTYKNWKSYVSTVSSAAAGLVHTGNRDIVECPTCEVTILNLYPQIDMTTEHALSSPGCLFLAKTRGKRFIRDAIQITTNLQNNYTNTINVVSPLEQVTGTERYFHQPRWLYYFMTGSTASLTMRLGYPPHIVHEVAYQCYQADKDECLESAEKFLRVLQKYYATYTQSKVDKPVCIENDQEFDLCIQCFVRKITHKILGCHHLNLCEVCSSLMAECPICLSPITSRMRIYIEDTNE